MPWTILTLRVCGLSVRNVLCGMPVESAVGVCHNAAASLNATHHLSSQPACRHGHGGMTRHVCNVRDVGVSDFGNLAPLGMHTIPSLQTAQREGWGWGPPRGELM
jgi:hypothetical protein